MARRTNIVSFEDARSQSRRSSAARSRSDARARDSYAQSGPERQRSTRQARQPRSFRQEERPEREQRSARRAERSEREQRSATRSARSATPLALAGEASGRSRSRTSSREAAAPKAGWFAWLPGTASPDSREAGTRGRRSSAADYSEDPLRNRNRSGRGRNDGSHSDRSRNERDLGRGEHSRNRNGADARENSRTTRENRRRERTKARADKMFTQQFGGETPPEPTEGAPRAAVYEGQMGAKHRRSARMQRSSAAGSSSSKANVAGWLSSLPLSARAIKVATVALCVVLFGVFLYAPAQQYYQAQREHDRLQVEYNTIEERNGALDEQNDILASDAGMEDAVRQKYGYVKAGEQVAYVAGLSDEASSARRDSDELAVNVLASTVKAPEEWYTPLLDTFFGVE